MGSGPSQILLVSDNEESVAFLEGALYGGQFRLHRLAQFDEVERWLADLLTTVDGAIVDGTAPCFSNGQLDRVLMLLDRHQLGALLLTGPTARPLAAGEFGLVWPVPADRMDLVGPVLAVMAAYQPVLRQLHREIRLLQRLDSKINVQLDELDEEMRLASRLQQDFLPRRLPTVRPAHFAALYRPAGWVSGDLYDVFRLDETHVGFYVADAVGHGVPAALLTMFIKRAIETKWIDQAGYHLLPPDQTLRLLNTSLLEAALSSSQFTTALYAVLDVRTLRLEFARGGHPHPIWLRHDGTTCEPEAAGSLLGVFPEAQFARRTIQLEPGDKLILYSDGLEQVFCEADSPGLRERLQAARHLPIDQILGRLADLMDRQAGSLNPGDDVTVVGLEIGA